MTHKPLKYIDAKGKNKEQLIRSQTPIHSKSANQSWYDNYDNIKWGHSCSVNEFEKICSKTIYKMKIRLNKKSPFGKSLKEMFNE